MGELVRVTWLATPRLDHEAVTIVPLRLGAGVLPLVRVAADVAEPDAGVGVDAEAGLARALAEREVPGEVPGALRGLLHERKVVGDERAVELRIASRERERRAPTLAPGVCRDPSTCRC